MRAALVTVVALALGCGPDAPAWDEGWERCEPRDPCVRVPSECCGCAGRAVVSTHAAEARAALGVSTCECEEAERCVDWTAECNGERCVVRDPRENAVRAAQEAGDSLPEERVCRDHAECRVIDADCLGQVATNTTSFSTVQSRVTRRLSAGIACGRRRGPPLYVYEPRCVRGACQSELELNPRAVECATDGECVAVRIGETEHALRRAWAEEHGQSRGLVPTTARPVRCDAGRCVLEPLAP